MSNRLFIPTARVPATTLAAIRRGLTLANPKANRRLRPDTPPAPATIHCYDETYNTLIAPRAAATTIMRALVDAGLPAHLHTAFCRPSAPPLTRRADFPLFAYQERAVAAVLAVGGGIVEVPCGGGKTVIGMEVAARACTPTLWLCHTTDLARQALGVARDLYGLHGDDIGFIGDGSWNPGSRLTVAMLQSLRDRNLTTLANSIGCLVLDEAHHAPADSFRAVVEAFPARLRLGLTATPERQDHLEAWMHLVFGPTTYRTTYRELADAGRIVLPDVGFVLTGVGSEHHAPEPTDHWTDAVSYLAASPARNRLILALLAQCVAEGRRCLVLTNLVKHADLLAQALQAVGVPTLPLVGKLSPKKRAATIDGFHSGHIRAIVATSLADEGLDLPELDTVLLASPARSGGRIAQRIGRVMRVHPDKQTPLVIDLVDEHGLYRHQATGRWAQYRELGARILPKGSIVAPVLAAS